MTADVYDWPDTGQRPKPKPAPPGLNIIGAGDIFAPLPPVQWLCKDLLVAPGAPTLFAGYGFSGKTAAAQAMCLGVATGTRIWGRYDTARGRVLHLDYEQGGRLSRERYHRLAFAEGISIERLIREQQLELGVLPSQSINADVLSWCGDGRALVLIDSWRAGHPGVDENSSEVRNTLDAMGQASERTGCVFELVVHAKKPTKDATGGNKFSIRGSSGFFDGAQTIFYLDGEERGCPIVTLEKDRITGAEMEPFSIKFQDLAERQGLLLRAQPVKTKDGKSVDQETLAALAIMHSVIEAHGVEGLSASNLAEAVGMRKAKVLALVPLLVQNFGVVSGGNGPTSRLSVPSVPE